MRMITSIAAVLLSACVTVADEATTSLNALNDQFNAFAADHDAVGLLSLYSKDTLWIEQGKPVSQGLDGPRELFEFVTANKGEVTHTIDHLYVSDDETLAVMIGFVEAKIETVGMDATGTYLFVLRPEDNGWEIVTDMWHQHTSGQN
ncbi:nuclear transport factor 2 family protein [Ruegeria sp. 2205SS24-7]|uniref:YybH family protein n=1 Tax=Ruegeria discodermiae TaxID=3064389 RepID=UPI002740DB72|nr:nuclear transport factor 2 family protein [Ruegeria sp. 2205SS24-7]MDP5220999.1 nuclear transport factor 2 family protein [Ruegeria sp. 2205SS24-7]